MALRLATPVILLLVLAQPSLPRDILIVTGGKSFDRESFYAMFSGFEGLRYDTASKPDVFSRFASGEMRRYDAVVFYDTYQPITDDESRAFLKLFELGIGCVFIHHALVSHQEWAEYETILGGRYHHSPYVDDGKKYGPSTYKHDQDVVVRIVDPEHPITKGLSSFTIRDEIYLNFKVHDGVVALLKTDICESGNPIGWTKTYGTSRIVYLQPGHDSSAYANEQYRLLLNRAIEWVAR